VRPLVVSAAAGAFGLAALRWLRVAQREHYLAGAAGRFAARWWRLPRNLPLSVTLVAATLAAFRWPAAGLLTAAMVAVGPLGLSWRGRTSQLAWTMRMRRLAGVVGFLGLASLVWSLAAGSVVPALAAALGVPWLVDVGLFFLGPIEVRLGRHWVVEAQNRLADSGARVVAITGSYGKTTTKSYLVHLLSAVCRVAASPASFNNRMGLARAINENVTSGTEVFVAEMGTYGPGEIANLCRFVPPVVAAITAIGPVHLERFGSLEAIVAAKAEILAGASVAVLNVDHAALAELAERESTRRRVIRCSSADPRAEVFVEAGSGQVWVEGRLIGSAPAGRAAAVNTAVAVGAAIGLGFEPARLAGRLADLAVPPHRANAVMGQGGLQIIDDTFNSNPAGAAAALENLGALAGDGRKVVVTPGMVELGRRQAAENAAFAASALAVADQLVVVGETNRAALLKGAGSGAVVTLPDRQAAVDWVRANLGAGDSVLYENDLPDHYP